MIRRSHLLNSQPLSLLSQIYFKQKNPCQLNSRTMPSQEFLKNRQLKREARKAKSKIKKDYHFYLHQSRDQVPQLPGLPNQMNSHNGMMTQELLNFSISLQIRKPKEKKKEETNLKVSQTICKELLLSIKTMKKGNLMLPS